VVPVQRGLLEPVNIAPRIQLLLVLLLLLFIGGQFILRVEYNCPAGWEGRMGSDVTRLEEQTAKDGRDGEVLAVGQMHNVDWCHDDVGGVARLWFKSDDG